MCNEDGWEANGAAKLPDRAKKAGGNPAPDGRPLGYRIISNPETLAVLERVAIVRAVHVYDESGDDTKGGVGQWYEGKDGCLFLAPKPYQCGSNEGERTSRSPSTDRTTLSHPIRSRGVPRSDRRIMT